jgi:hypothetical protein
MKIIAKVKFCSHIVFAYRVQPCRRHHRKEADAADKIIRHHLSSLRN